MVHPGASLPVSPEAVVADAAAVRDAFIRAINHSCYDKGGLLVNAQKAADLMVEYLHEVGFAVVERPPDA